MNKQFTSTDKHPTQADQLEQEISELEAKMLTEKSATALNDIRLRLKFLKWKKELLTIAYGK